MSQREKEGVGGGFGGFAGRTPTGWELPAAGEGQLVSKKGKGGWGKVPGEEGGVWAIKVTSREKDERIRIGVFFQGGENGLNGVTGKNLPSDQSK